MKNLLLFAVASPATEALELNGKLPIYSKRLNKRFSVSSTLKCNFKSPSWRRVSKKTKDHKIDIVKNCIAESTAHFLSSS